MTTIRGHYDGRVFVPEEPVNFSSNEQVLLHVQRLHQPNDKHISAREVATSSVVGMWRNMWPDQSSSNIARGLRSQAQTRGNHP